VRIVKAKEAHVFSNIMMRMLFQKKKLLAVFQSFVKTVRVANTEQQHALLSTIIPKVFLRQKRKTRSHLVASLNSANQVRVADIKIQHVVSNIMMQTQSHQKLLLVALIKIANLGRAAKTKTQHAFSSIIIPKVFLQQKRKTKGHPIASLNFAN